ncbi:hypothetical protein MTR67_018492 [Solanum verrucosum]|uniref:Uncharacterized protein n=1 Tax=Solanum verrucosum TaxID=315347 RepID=A0AAF0QJS6_SOLVR|nr:hypothetical protein MTR67_018492 [Solanum verrucosum]
METGNETHQPKGKVTLDSIMGSLTNMSRIMGKLEGRMTNLQGSLSMMGDRMIKVEGGLNSTYSTPQATYCASTRGQTHTRGHTHTTSFAITSEPSIKHPTQHQSIKKRVVKSKPKKVMQLKVLKVRNKTCTREDMSSFIIV